MNPHKPVEIQLSVKFRDELNSQYHIKLSNLLESIDSLIYIGYQLQNNVIDEMEKVNET